jgi:hypothetical protein
MSGKRPQWNGDGSWTHPRSEKVLEAAGMKTIAVDVHHQTVANSSSIDRSMLCTGAERKRGSPVHPFWWDQPMDLDLAREGGLWPSSSNRAGAEVIEEDEDTN